MPPYEAAFFLSIGDSPPSDVAVFRAFRKSEHWFFDWNQIGKKTPDKEDANEQE
ncbi:hypothetical protein [Jiella pelagia]|uniref:Uncharacterized protein n=1 Tax=Jiella pelagia TaxID=2986949 RepID=A0ABY7C3E5_9HYPH|nr:hypothetical protein [Jiella pelagia]WAP69385.1 hypothetical protein OH818_03625 [Jiella pelagia]